MNKLVCSKCGTISTIEKPCKCVIGATTNSIAMTPLSDEVPRRVNLDQLTKPLPSPLDQQVGGDHYKKKGIQPWEYISANELGFFEGNVVKYITRHKDKNGLEDLKKARHYLDYLISLGEAK